MSAVAEDRIECPACGGAGGGPFGPAGSAWDDDEYMCPRCEGTGWVSAREPVSARPGVVKATPGKAPAPARRRAAGDDES